MWTEEPASGTAAAALEGEEEQLRCFRVRYRASSRRSDHEGEKGRGGAGRGQSGGWGAGRGRYTHLPFRIGSRPVPLTLVGPRDSLMSWFTWFGEGFIEDRGLAN